MTHHIPGGLVSHFHASSLGSEGFAAAAATRQGAVQVIFGRAGSSTITTWLDPASSNTQVSDTRFTTSLM